MSPDPDLSLASLEPDDSIRPEVLLVEDNADMRACLRKHLAKTYEVLEATRGDEGLGLVRTEMPDVVVSDVMMPGLDGYALCRAVKADPETDFIPVILLTAKTDTPSKIEGLEGGADDYICKPFDPSELLLRIRNLLRARARLKARYRSQLEPPSPEPASVPIPASGTGLKNRVRTVLDRESQEESFDVAALAKRLGMSRSHLHRRIKEDFGFGPSELIVRFRLERAAAMLIRGAGNVGEIAYAVGFKNLAHFCKRFRERYQQTPASYAQSHPAAPGRV
jgi:DNA-binding response OmpR family regulator